MARLTLRRVRDNIDTRILGQTGLRNDQQIKRRILQRELDATGNLAIATVLNEQNKLVARQTAARKYGQPGRRTKATIQPGQRRNYASPEGFNECGVAKGKSHASKVAERMERTQDGFPNVTRHPTTVGVAVLPPTANVAEEINAARSSFRKVYKKLTPGSQISGGFHVAMKTAAELAEVFPMGELPNGFDPVNRPDEILGYLHFHGVIADPYLTKKHIRDILKSVYPGCKRVCVAKVQPERTDKNGQVTHGAQGYLEYAMMNKTEVKFEDPNQKREAVIAHAMLSATWGKRNQALSIGKPLSTTGVQIDPSRVAQLELIERLGHVRKNWGRLSYAEQFIHAWMSGMVLVVQKLQHWIGFGDSFKERFAVLWGLVRKWSLTSEAESTDFLIYLDAALE